jgi:GxxExxY protein
MELLHSQITKKILRAYFNVYNNLGYGFLEKVYENAMIIELKNLGLNAVQQKQIKVFYQDSIIGDFVADIIVEGKVICELKAINELAVIHEVQLVNYLKATEIEVGLLLNFGHKPEYVRKVFTKEYK